MGRHEEAIAGLHRAVALSPSTAEFHNSLGGVLGSLGRYLEAVQSLREAVALHPHYPEAHKNLGIALNGLGDLDGAIGEVCPW
jgi:Flp pilus assembly protein TadD